MTQTVSEETRILVFLLFITSIVNALDGVRWWSTSRATTDRLAEKDPIPFSTLAGFPDLESLTVVTINVGTSFQRIVGFGGALTQSSAAVFASLSRDLQAEVFYIALAPFAVHTRKHLKAGTA